MDGKPRELHTELASKALDFEVIDEYRTIYDDDAHRANHCIDSPFFNVRVVDVEAPFHRNLLKYDSFIITMCLEGDCKLRMRSELSLESEVVLNEGHSCLIPAAIADYDVIPLNGRSLLLDAFIDNKDRSLLSRATRFLHITDK